MTRILAIETSAEACSVAILDGGRLLEFFEHAPMKHAELLLPAVQSLLAQAELPLSDVDAIAFGRGPGSFTSLRIGIGVVQGLAWAAERPVVPVSSLAAIAQEAFESAGEAAPLVRVATDARMQEVYCGDFSPGDDGTVRGVAEERVCPPDEFGEGSGEPFIAAGNGFERFDELRTLAGRAVCCLPSIQPRAAVVARLAACWLQRNEPLPPMQAQPVYVRNEVAKKAGS
jgi:tRNA threonylcarbamoyladenosine biosynthesis protein TsaB